MDVANTDVATSTDATLCANPTTHELTKRQTICLVAIVTLNLIGIALAAWIPEDGPGGRFATFLDYVCIGYLLGTLWGQATLACIWLPLGPFKLRVRLPVSLLWFALLLGSLWINLDDPEGATIVGVFAGCFALQWFVSQLLLVPLVVYSKARITGVVPGSTERELPQFGIRSLFVLMFIVAALFTLGRTLLLKWPQSPIYGYSYNNYFIFVFLTGAAVLLTLPLVLACFLKRYCWMAVGAALAWIVVATQAEMPLLDSLNITGGADFWHIVAINGFQTFWALSVCFILRYAGFSLMRKT